MKHYTVALFALCPVVAGLSAGSVYAESITEVNLMASTNCVETVAGAMAQLVIKLNNPELTAEEAITAFNVAGSLVHHAANQARLDRNKARQDLVDFYNSPKAAEVQEIMDNASNKRLQELLDTDEEVGKAFQRYIVELSTFDRILNGDL